MQEEGKQNS